MQEEITNLRLVHLALLVRDYDEAIAYYTGVLSFVIKEDTRLSETKRWVLLAPPGDGNCCILLAKAANEEQRSRVGNQTGGRVFLFLHTDDLDRTVKIMKSRKVHFVREPVEEAWGKVAVFQDLYGNLWDLIQPVHDRPTL